MSPLTLLHAALVGLLLGGAAAALEAALRQRRLPTRGVWAAALALTLAAPLWGPALQRRTDVGSTSLAELAVTAPFVPEGEASTSSPADELRRRLATSDPRIATFWAAAAAVALLMVTSSFVRLSTRVARMPRGRVGGDEVVISPAFGPACVGLARPRVVIPRWLLALGRSELDLVIRHERSHAEARDPLLLAAALGAVALAPWNPALWWQMVRLRRSVELDCDRRVLASGTAPAAYGRVLLSVLGRLRTPSFPAPALLEPTSFLERRLELMRHRLPTAPHRTLGALALAAGLVALACEAPAPTSIAPAEPAGDGAPATAPAAAAPAEGIRIVGASASEPAPTIYVDGVLVDAGEIDDLDPSDIAAVEVVKGAQAIAELGEKGSHGIIRIKTRGAAGPAEAAAAAEDEGAQEKRPFVLRDRPLEGGTITGRDATLPEATATVQSWAAGRRPLVLVDGEPLAGGIDALLALPKEGPRSIASIEVVKGRAAEAVYGPEGRDGVVSVRTKGAAGGG